MLHFMLEQSNALDTPTVEMVISVCILYLCCYHERIQNEQHEQKDEMRLKAT